ncbi:glycosyltransferase family 2 protein [Bacillus sp. N1-1]|uniref:glycosyltransferase family 2 protein n=1 Tax=Bacillus sp. N1-1 TaxID=2682541 RepID=UPI0013185C1E|nr:glycosyltransferase family 2 protein [Bacillus sp. N1-1]QHA93700.1 glycosyltransferase [Bacillus sp. N1-1]
MGNSKKNSVAIILLNWNSYKDTYECLKSLENLAYESFHVFVVDNASTDHSYEKLVKDGELGVFRSEVTFIQSGGNLGFAGGNNVGIKQAYELGYDYIWLLNNDTTVDEHSLSTLITVIDKDERIGIVGSKIYFADTNLLWFAGGQVNYYSGSTHHVGYKKKDKGQYDKIKHVQYIVGCSLLFRRELIESVGYLEEDYFLYYEDTDWNIRASRKGWDILYVPQSIVYHKVSSSSSSKDVAPFFAYYNIRNAYLMIQRNEGKFAQFSAAIHVIWKVIEYLARMIVKNQEGKRRRSYLIMLGALDGFRERIGKKELQAK